MAKTTGRTCRSSTEAGRGRRWGCSLPAGHKGEVHRAKNMAGVTVYSWPATPRVARVRPSYLLGRQRK